MGKLHTGPLLFYFSFRFLFLERTCVYYSTDPLQYLLLFAMQNKTAADDALFEFKDFGCSCVCL